MSTNEIFSKDVLSNIIEDNLDILRRCIEGTIYQQWTAVILLMQFIEYVLKYKIQSANRSFRPIHRIKYLYDRLTDEDRNDIEKRFCQLMANCPFKYPKRLCSIKEFASRFNTSYTFWRYEMIKPNANSDKNAEGYEEYFYLADTLIVLHALIESTDLEIDPSAIPNVDKMAQKALKPGVQWRPVIKKMVKNSVIKGDLSSRQK